MTNLSLEYGLTRSRGSAVILFHKQGSGLHVYILEPTECDDIWTGEVGAVSAAECLVAADKLKAWVMKPAYHPRGGHVPCKLEIDVTNYGIAHRFADSEMIYAEPHPDIDTITLLVEKDTDAAYLVDLFREMNRRLQGLL